MSVLRCALGCDVFEHAICTKALRCERVHITTCV